MKGVESSKAKIGINNGAMAAKWQYQLAKAMSAKIKRASWQSARSGGNGQWRNDNTGENISVAIMAANQRRKRNVSGE
jgi:hypothetical protein